MADQWDPANPSQGVWNGYTWTHTPKIREQPMESSGMWPGAFHQATSTTNIPYHQRAKFIAALAAGRVDDYYAAVRGAVIPDWDKVVFDPNDPRQVASWQAMMGAMPLPGQGWFGEGAPPPGGVPAAGGADQPPAVPAAAHPGSNPERKQAVRSAAAAVDRPAIRKGMGQQRKDKLRDRYRANKDAARQQARAGFDGGSAATQPGGPAPTPPDTAGSRLPKPTAARPGAGGGGKRGKPAKRGGGGRNAGGPKATKPAGGATYARQPAAQRAAKQVKPVRSTAKPAKKNKKK